MAFNESLSLLCLAFNCVTNTHTHPTLSCSLESQTLSLNVKLCHRETGTAQFINGKFEGGTHHSLGQGLQPLRALNFHTNDTTIVLN